MPQGRRQTELWAEAGHALVEGAAEGENAEQEGWEYKKSLEITNYHLFSVSWEIQVIDWEFPFYDFWLPRLRSFQYDCI